MSISTVFSDSEISELFAVLEPHPRIAVGVSGGLDSMALLQLLLRWQGGAGNEGRELIVFTVDHGLRDGSGEEARWVGLHVRSLAKSIPNRLHHRILKWEGEKPRRGIQEAARKERYRLMALAAQAEGCEVLVVAHHLQDQAETFFMRLVRGSGLDGLSGMAPIKDIFGIEVHRPLLGILKSRLHGELVANDVKWIEDPSNQNTDFERVRIREMLAQLGSIGVEARSVVKSVRRLARARRALEEITMGELDSAVDFNEGAFGRIDMDRYFRAPEEIRLRILGQVISRLGGRRQVPQLSKLENMCEALSAARKSGKVFAGSLGGALIRGGTRNIDVFREPNRGDIEEMALVPGAEPVIWDGRFSVGIGSMAGRGITIGALGEVGLGELKEIGVEMPDMPRDALLAMPVLRENGRLVGIPINVSGVISGLKLDDAFFTEGKKFVSDQNIEIFFIGSSLCQRETKTGKTLDL